MAAHSMDTENFLKQRLICVAVIDRADDAVPLAEALLAGGLNCIEVTFRTDSATDAIALICKHFPHMSVGAGTLLSAENVKRAVDAGAKFGVSPALNESVLSAARQCAIPFFPGVMTPTEIARALELSCSQLKFFPAEVAGGAAMLKALAAPFAHAGVKFIPTGGVTTANMPDYLAVPQVAAVGGSWMAERQFISEKAWLKITALTVQALKIVVSSQRPNS